MSGGDALLHRVGLRIVDRYLTATGRGLLARVDIMDDAGDVDLAYREGARRIAATLKVDPYFGTDPMKARDRSLRYYRPASGTYAIETIANALTREAGWLFRSQADVLCYYRLAIAQPEAEVAALMQEPDAVFFSELAVERDGLTVIPLPALRAWLNGREDAYVSRPVVGEGRCAWCRIVPGDDLESAVAGIVDTGPVFPLAAAEWRTGV